MPAPTLFEVTQAVIAVLVVIGSGVLFATGQMTSDVLTLIVGTVLGFYFGAARSTREVDAITHAALLERNIKP